MTGTRPEPPNSPTGRDLVDCLDQFIMLRFAQMQGNPVDQDRLEELKRILTDSFLAMDRRGGLYIVGEHKT